MPDWQNFSDQELIALAQKGEREAFEEIYHRYGEAIYRYLYAHVSHEQDAEDMTADVFLSLWRTLGQYRQNERVPFYVFLYRMARNRLVDYYRRQRTRAGDTDSPEVGEQNAAPRAAPLVIAGMEVGDLHRYLLKLPPDYRTVLVLRFLNDLSHEETAQVMGKSYAAVRVLQHRALAALRALMQRGEE